MPPAIARQRTRAGGRPAGLPHRTEDRVGRLENRAHRSGARPKWSMIPRRAWSETLRIRRACRIANFSRHKRADDRLKDHIRIFSAITSVPRSRAADARAGRTCRRRKKERPGGSSCRPAMRHRSRTLRRPAADAARAVAARWGQRPFGSGWEDQAPRPSPSTMMKYSSSPSWRPGPMRLRVYRPALVEPASPSMPIRMTVSQRPCSPWAAVTGSIR
jgi:hypothetical protein